MTLDQIWGRLCDADILTRGTPSPKTKKYTSLAAATAAKKDADGRLVGRTKDGQMIKGRVAGVSKAQQVIQAKKEKEKQEQKKKAEEQAKITRRTKRG